MVAGERIDGRCLCGAVGFSAALKDAGMGVCHCGQCRRWTSGVFMYLSILPESLELTGARSLGVFRSSEIAERGFCATCGTSIFWRLHDGSQIDVSAQALDEPSRFPFKTEVFFDDKPSNYAFANETRKLTNAESAALGRPRERADG